MQAYLDELYRHGLREGAAGSAAEAASPAEPYDGEAAAAFAAQTLNVFVPIAHRLGMWYFKTELEELCFAVSKPQAFRKLSSSLQQARAPACSSRDELR